MRERWSRIALRFIQATRMRRVEVFYLRRFSLAVNDMLPAPQHGQLAANSAPCFCSSSRSVLSSMLRKLCANKSCSEAPY